MPIVPKGSLPAQDEEARPGLHQGAGRLLLTTVWFGLLAGWLELGWVLVQRAVDPHVSFDALRTNRHYLWMIPVADLLIFGVVGLAVGLLARVRRGLAWWVALRLSVGLSSLTLLLTVEGLHAIACVALACGLASVIGPWLGRRVTGFGRPVRISFAVMAVGLVVLTGLAYERVVSAERRALSSCPPATPGAPNVLLIVLDTVRAANVSLYGYSRPTTPNLNRLARKGIVFTEARSTAPWTLPSHASMFTGRWPHELSVGPDLPLDGNFPTLAEALARGGYATAGFVGNTGYCNALLGTGRGFARYEDYYENRTVSLFETVRSTGLGKRVIQALGYPIRLADGETSVRKTAAMLNRDVLGWLAARPAGRPFFVFVNYYDAHDPYIPPGDADQRFGMAALPLAEQVEIEKRFLDLAAGRLEPTGRIAERIYRDGLEKYRDDYDSCIAYLDHQIGLLMKEMERRGSLENTLVIVTSDHGENLGEHDLLGHGVSLYSPEVRVPLLVIPPSRSSTSAIVNAPVSLREIPATVAEWVGLGPRNPFPGRPLTRFTVDGAERLMDTSPVLCEVEHIPTARRAAHVPASLGPVRSLVSRDWAYIRGEGGREELYDLVYDPLESTNLAVDPQSGPVLDRFRDDLGRLSRGGAAPAR